MSEHSEAVQRLASTAFDDDGWMSDAQDARLEWDEDNQSLHFCGEGSIDVGHMVSLVLADQGKPQITEGQIIDRFSSLSNVALLRIAGAAERVIEGRNQDGVMS